MQGHQALSPSLEKDVMGSRCVIVGTNRYIAFIHGTSWNQTSNYFIHLSVYETLV